MAKSKHSFPIRPQLKGRSIVLPERIGRCLWCGKDLSFDGRRISFCKEKHADKYYGNFVFAESAFKIFDRDQYKCVKCGFNEKEFQKELDKKFNPYDWRKPAIRKKRNEYIESMGFSLNQAYLEIDHIIAVRMGGDPIDPDNLQTLCYPCHKKKTKQDITKISNINAVCREIKGNIKLKKEIRKMDKYWKKYR